MGVIVPMDGPSKWVSSMVVTEKPNNKIRVCLDPRDLNKAILREHYKIPTADEVFSQMHEAKYFTKLDASSGYWQARVDEDSSQLLTFNTPFGRYRYTRLPSGVHSDREFFQQKIAQILDGQNGVINYQDDILIWASSKEEHEQRLTDVMR